MSNNKVMEQKIKDALKIKDTEKFEILEMGTRFSNEGPFRVEWCWAVVMRNGSKVHTHFVIGKEKVRSVFIERKK